jgi:hypothetical protein
MANARGPSKLGSGPSANGHGHGHRPTLRELAYHKRLPVEFLRDELGLHDLPGGGVGIPYYDRDRRQVALRIRTALCAKFGSSWPKGTSPRPYGEWRLGEAHEGQRLVLVEGESDCWPLWHKGIPALGVPGANLTEKLTGEHFAGVPVVYVHREPDAGGETFVRGVAARLVAVGFAGRAFELRMPDGLKDPADLWADDGARFRSRFEEAVRSSSPLVGPRGPAPVSGGGTAGAPGARRNHPYEVREEGICRVFHPRKGGEGVEPLCNFDAVIKEELIRDDGAERRIFFAIEGELQGGRPLARVEVPAGEFASLDWVLESWGSAAVVNPGRGVKDHLRAALQRLSGEASDSGVVPSRTVYSHTGWRMVGGSSVYLHAGGAIGPAGLSALIDVKLPEALALFRLPSPPEGDRLIEAVRASLGQLSGLAPARLAFPLLASPYRAALGDCDFAPFLVGGTGRYKSGLLSLPQQHFGPGMSWKKLPASWGDTANSLLELAFVAKDTLLAVDDFVPSRNPGQFQKAEFVFRAQANGSGRGRMARELSLIAPRPPRGTIFGSGEELPPGDSSLARLFSLEVGCGDVCFARLKECDRDAGRGLYAQSMAGYIRWLAPQLDEVKGRLKRERDDLYDQASVIGGHARTPGIVADLALGLRYLLDFALWCGAITWAERAELERRGWEAFLEAAASHSRPLDESDPVHRFFRLINAVIGSGRGHLAARDGGAPLDPEAWGWRRSREAIRSTGAARSRPPTYEPQGHKLGWVEGDDVYLEPLAAHAAAQELAQSGQQSPLVSCDRLQRLLKDKDKLASTEKNKTTQRRKLEGVNRPVLHLKRETLLGPSE